MRLAIESISVLDTSSTLRFLPRKAWKAVFTGSGLASATGIQLRPKDTLANPEEREEDKGPAISESRVL